MMRFTWHNVPRPALRNVQHHTRVGARCIAIAAMLLLPVFTGSSVAHAQGVITDPAQDMRVGLKAGWMDAGSAIRNMELLASRPRPEGFFDARALGNLGLANSDMAFRGNTLFVGNFTGFQIYDISTPSNPTLITAFVCPGGQGDLSVHGNLLFMSVEATNGRIDCGAQGAPGAVNPDRFRGVRIFDISNLTAPKQIAAVQTCRGSHTHTLVPDAKDAGTLYVYVSGTSIVRPDAELAGCSGGDPEQDPNTSLFRIEIIRVPLAEPAKAAVVNAPRIFADRNEPRNIAGLWRGGSHGEGKQESAPTDQCHDITVYPELGLAAGACSGNGILLDISDPANPVRIDEVIDTNFAYWHSATFSNDGRSIIFTDEWGGGVAPRCRATDLPQWGANAIFTVKDRKMSLASYYKIPAAQTAQENCVAHNGSLVPVPGRDIKVQAWYQGGISVFDFTDPATPKELAYFDRGPMSDSVLYLSGFWSAYWYNGNVYGSEIGRGLDILSLTPSDVLSTHEIAAAALARVDVMNPQLQTRVTWPAAFVVAYAYFDQLARGTAVDASTLGSLRATVERAETMAAGAERTATLQQAASRAESMASGVTGRNAERLQGIATTLRGIARGA